MMDGPLNGMASRVAWEDAPNPLPHDPPVIIRPKVGEELELILLDPKAVCVWLHWVRGRSSPHLSGPGRCPGCEEEGPARLYGYISAIDVRHSRTGLAELTEYALSRCAEVVEPSPDRPLRSRHALLRRSAGHRQARCILTLTERYYRGELRQGFNVRLVLEGMWARDPVTARLLGLRPAKPEKEGEGNGED